jgi:hypothetical protein
MRKFTTIAALAAGLLILPSANQSIAQSSGPAPRVIAPDDQPTKEQLAKLFEVMRLRQQMDTMMKSMSAMMQQQVTQQIKNTTGNLPSGGSISAAQQEKIDQLMQKYMDRAMNLYPVSEMIDDMSAIYQKHMSREDVDAYIVFYTSPAGQHLLDEQPSIMKEYLPIVSQRMQERTKTLTDEMTKDIEQLAKPQGQQK